jgi:hypothetical protein
MSSDITAQSVRDRISTDDRFPLAAYIHKLPYYTSQLHQQETETKRKEKKGKPEYNRQLMGLVEYARNQTGAAKSVYILSLTRR